MKALGIIPARGGSEGVKNKNLRVVAGEPLIAYAIRVGPSDTLVMTDDPEISRYAEGRVIALTQAQADGSVVDASRYALLRLESLHGFEYDSVVLLQPDSPIRLPTDIDNCLKMLEDNPTADGVLSVCRVEDEHPAHMYRPVVKELGFDEPWLASLDRDHEVGSRQGLPPVYRRNGAIYAVRRQALMEQGWLPAWKLPYVMPRELSLTIDTEFDLLMADYQVRLWKEGKLWSSENPSLLSAQTATTR